MKKKKIFWMGDDLRTNSGIATMTREIVLGTVNKYDYCCISGLINHPDKGKVVDLSDATKQLTGVKDAYVRLYPTDGYGDEELIFSIIAQEKPDCIVHFTDPRFWGHLYNISQQLRKTIPVTYISVWDSLPFPMWNKNYSYMNCDCIMSISKQSHNIAKWVLGPENCRAIDGEFDKNGNIVVEQ